MTDDNAPPTGDNDPPSGDDKPAPAKRASKREYKPAVGDLVQLGGTVEKWDTERERQVPEYTTDPERLGRAGIAPAYGVVVAVDPVRVAPLGPASEHALPLSKVG
ncbi:MAG TPA: hypothetical protein VK659_10245 [Asanoa sp.]|nr:hypothetical protein [Asanoa sp.]